MVQAQIHGRFNQHCLCVTGKKEQHFGTTQNVLNTYYGGEIIPEMVCYTAWRVQMERFVPLNNSPYQFFIEGEDDVSGVDFHSLRYNKQVSS